MNDKTTHKCEDCGFMTQMAEDLFHHTIYEHNPEEAPAIIRELKPVYPAVIYLLAEPNVVLGEEVKKLRTHVTFVWVQQTVRSSYWSCHRKGISLKPSNKRFISA